MSETSQTPAKNPKNGGLPTVFAAIAIQMTLGIAYLWSVFQTGIANTIFNEDHASAGLTFSLLLATLTVGSVIGGKLAAKYSIRRVVFFGGVILSLGFFLASFVTAQAPWLLWVTYGLMGGTGMGFTYSTTIACAQKWYPHKRGLVTGIIVAALGFGGVVFTPIIEGLIASFGGYGVGEQQTFVVLSAIFFVVCTIGSLFLKVPSSAEAAAGNAASSAVNNDISPGQMLRTPRFYILTLAFALTCLGGLMIINYAKPVAVMKGFDESTAAIGVIAISLFNSFGRLLWGMVSDKIGRINTLVILLSGSAILALFIIPVNGWAVFAIIGSIGLFYGGFLSNFPSLTADIFGAKHLATNYGFVLLGFGSGAIAASQIGGYFKNIADTRAREIAETLSVSVENLPAEDKAEVVNLMLPAFVIGSCCAVVSIALILILKAMNKKT
jgi:OFA family oxalate/formate antiporter-like MFS transporter